MECSRYMEQLDIASSMEMDEPYFAEALDHAENCSDCRDRLSKRVTTENAMVSSMESAIAVPESLFKAIESQTKSHYHSRRRFSSFRYIAAGVLLLLGVSVSGWDHWQDHKRTSAAIKLCTISIRNHELTSYPEYIARDRYEVSRWLTDRMGRLAKFPDNLNPTEVTLAAKRVVLGEHTAAAVEFDINGKRTTLFSYYPEQHDVQDITEPPKTEMGYTVALWSEDGLGYSLVSEASPEEVNAVFTTASPSKHASSF